MCRLPTTRGLCVLVMAVLGLAAAPPVWANTISYTTSTPIPSSTTDWTGGLTFQQFNPSLGTLTGVELNFSGGLTTDLTILNDAVITSHGDADTKIEVFVQDPPTTT